MIRRHIRILCRQPGFTIPVLTTMALGIGITTAVFSLVYAILLRPLPYPESERLLRVSTVMSREGNSERNASLLDIEDYNRRAKLLENFGGYTVFDSQLDDGDSAQAVVIAQLNQEALRALNVAPILGRLFTPDEDRKGGPVHKAILSFGLWQSRYGGDRSIIGRTVSGFGTSYEVVGVMPSAFRFPDRSDLWLPMESYYTLRNVPRQRDSRSYATIARLKASVSLQQAQSEMDRISEQLEAEYPRENGGVRVRLSPLREATIGSIRPYVLLVAGGVLLVLLISLVNVVNLYLARVLERRRQYVIQAALGASRWDLATALLSESLMLSATGGVLGVTIAWTMVEGFKQLLPASIPAWLQIRVDPIALAFCFIVAVVAGVGVGLTPALIGSRANLESALRKGTRSSSTTSKGRSVLVVCEVALSLVLLVGAGLLVKTFRSLQKADHGFQADNLIVALISNNSRAVGNRETRAGLLANYHEQMRERLLQVPGVKHVAVTNRLPYSGTETRKGRLRILGKSDEEVRFLLPVGSGDVHADFFETMNIGLVHGRYFERTDSPNAFPVVVINETGAKALFGDQDAIGRMVQWGDVVGPTNPYCRIVGIVRDVKWEAAEEGTIQLYYPFTQWPVGTAYYLLRTDATQREVASQIRRVVQEIDHKAAVVWIKSMTERIDEALWQRRLWGAIFSAFAALAVVLAAVGLYGVLAYIVSQQNREIGIRIAIGAKPFEVSTMVLSRGMKLTFGGIAIGAAVSVGAIRVMAGLVAGNVIQDWTIYAGVAAVVLLTGAFSSVGPALRACRIDPVIALREEL